MTPMSDDRAAPEDRGMLAIVLHSHLPWLAHHGAWPVGEEWLYQSWAHCYLPLTRVLRRLADDGFSNQLTIGITPVLAAQLDDPYSLTAMRDWLANWQLRAAEASVGGHPLLGRREYAAAATELADFTANWQHGGSAVFADLADRGIIEVLGGPLAHPFQPLLDPRLRRFALAEGLRDGQRRMGTSSGIWAPECAYAPGMENDYAWAQVTHFLVDGPALGGDTALGRTVGESSVVAFGRDLQVAYRVWSPKSGYPGHGAYRDFYTHDHDTGFKPARVTGKSVPPESKQPYDPELASAAIDVHVADFVDTVRERLASESDRIGRKALVVTAFDTELFGHWWFEGPIWLERVLRALREAGITVGTLAQARERGYVGAPVTLEESSWGSGKDWRVWNGPQVSEFVDLNADVVSTALAVIDKRRSVSPAHVRDRVNDQLLIEALLTAQSDWPFMVSKDTAAGYARDRAYKHAHAAREIAAAAADGLHSDAAEAHARELAAGWHRADNPFPAVDARRLEAI